MGLLTIVFLLAATQPAFAHPGHGDRLLSNITEQILTPQLTITGLTLAYFFGAVHGLTPGHGKTIATAYLVGSNSTFTQALILSAIVTITHTVGIFALGLTVLLASHYLLPEQLYYIFSLLSGITISVIGFWQLESYFNPPVDEHHHHYSDCGCEADDLKVAGNPRPHVLASPSDSASRRHRSNSSLISMGIAGGLIPCSEALILLLGAIAIHQEIYGLELVAAFSLGLGFTLTIVGSIAVYCRGWLDRLPNFESVRSYFPLISAVAVSIAGLILTTEAII